MFSEYISSVEKKIAFVDFETVNVNSTLKKAKRRQILSFEELGALLNVDPERQREFLRKIVGTSKEIKQKIFQNRIFPIVPLYITSFCSEHCRYCNFRVENANQMIQRIRLSSQQIQEELEYLVFKKRMRVIELVYATDSLILPEIPNHIKLAHQILDRVGGGMVGINAGPFTVEEYRLFKDAGLDFVVLWQETYQREYYEKMHPGNTKKSDFDYRVDDFERVMEAGIRNISLGVLSGIAPWRKDWLIMMEHERYLLENYGIQPSIVGIPRLKPAVGAAVQSTPYTPSDDELLLAVTVHNLFSPQTLPFVNTRESFELCTELSKGGGALFTFNCRTIPGGYVFKSKGYEFPTYSFDVDGYLPKIQSQGLTPIFTWRFDKNHVPNVLYEG